MKSKIIHVRVSPELSKKLKQTAKGNKISLSELVRELIEIEMGDLGRWNR